MLANELRKYQASVEVERLEVAAASLDIELPDKTKQQLLERYCEVGPMERFIRGTKATVGGTVDSEFWDDLVRVDPLAAEIDDICRAAA